jgi:hypothetical protein
VMKKLTDLFPKLGGKYEALDKDAFVAFDANAVLHLYKEEAKDLGRIEKVVTVLDSLATQPFFSYYAMEEFAKHRSTYLNEGLSTLEKDGEMMGYANQVHQHFVKLGQKQGCTPADLVYLKGKIDEIRRYIKMQIPKEKAICEGRNYFKKWSNTPKEDPLVNFLNKVFRSLPYEGAQLKKKEIDGRTLMLNKTAPGHADEAKKSGQRNGNTLELDRNKELFDYFIWSQSLDDCVEAAKTKKSSQFVFVTDDVKEDWFLQPPKGKGVAGKDTGPLPSLLNEAVLRTGLSVKVITLSDFLEMTDPLFVEKLVPVSEREADQPTGNALDFGTILKGTAKVALDVLAASNRFVLVDPSHMIYVPNFATMDAPRGITGASGFFPGPMDSQGMTGGGLGTSNNAIAGPTGSNYEEDDDIESNITAQVKEDTEFNATAAIVEEADVDDKVESNYNVHPYVEESDAASVTRARKDAS